MLVGSGFLNQILIVIAKSPIDDLKFGIDV